MFELLLTNFQGGPRPETTSDLLLVLVFSGSLGRHGRHDTWEGFRNFMRLSNFAGSELPRGLFLENNSFPLKLGLEWGFGQSPEMGPKVGKKWVLGWFWGLGFLVGPSGFFAGFFGVCWCFSVGFWGVSWWGFGGRFVGGFRCAFRLQKWVKMRHSHFLPALNPLRDIDKDPF